MRRMKLTSTIQPAVGRDRDICHQGEREKSLEESHGCRMLKFDVFVVWLGIFAFDDNVESTRHENLPLDEMKRIK